eukprot:jgi/Ulvmu1/611/UM001_0619.1
MVFVSTPNPPHIPDVAAERCGVQRGTMRTNLLIHYSGLGECNKLTFTNPSVDKTFGVPKQADPEGARELTMLWKEHKANPLDMPGPDFLSMNKHAAIKGLTTASQQHQFRARAMVVTQTADRLLAREKARQVLRTSCGPLDDILAGGVRCEEVTEFCGIPGSGKTQLGMQLAFCTQLPPACGGLGGTCIILDTEGSVIPSRAATIAGHILHAKRLQHPDALQQDGTLTVDTLLDGVHICRIHGVHELVSACVALSSQIPSTVRLVVLDSIAAPFRSQQLQHQAVMLETIATSLRQIASLGVAVVVMNHVVGTIGQSSDGIKPALGTAWASQPAHRLLLSIEESERHARVLKSAWLPPKHTKYAISDQGVIERSMPT